MNKHTGNTTCGSEQIVTMKDLAILKSETNNIFCKITSKFKPRYEVWHHQINFKNCRKCFTTLIFENILLDIIQFFYWTLIFSIGCLSVLPDKVKLCYWTKILFNQTFKQSPFLNRKYQYNKIILCEICFDKRSI